MIQSKFQSKVLSRVRLVVLAAGLCAVMTACEEKDASGDALQKANVELAALSPFGTPSVSAQHRTKKYSEIIKSLQPVASSSVPSQKAAANLLIAQSQAGLAEPSAIKAAELERSMLNDLSGIRSRLDQFLTQSTNAAAAAAYDPSKEIAAIEQADKEKAEQIKTEQAKKAAIDAKVAGLHSQAKAKADQARVLEQEAGVCRTKVPNLNATDGEKELVKARELSRKADALEVESASLEAAASSTAPEGVEVQNSIDRLNKQRELLGKERSEIAKRTQAAKDKAAATRAEAAKTSDEIKKAVATIEELRAGDLKAANEEAANGYSKASSGAKGAASEMKSTAQMTIGAASQALADLHLSRAQGLQAFAQVLESLATVKPALPDAAAYKTKCDDARAAAKEAIEAAREAYKDADAAYHAAGATGEAKTRLEKLNRRFRDLVVATGGDKDLIPTRGEAETPPPAADPTPAPATAAAGDGPETVIQAMIDIASTGSLEKMEELMLFENDGDRKTFRSLVAIVPAARRLDAAAKAKFGQSIPGMGAGLEQMSAGPLKVFQGLKVSDVQFTVNGETAVANIPGDKTPTKLKKKDGKWYIDGSDMPADMKEMASTMEAMAKSLNDVAADIESGKVADMQSVGMALQKAMAPFMAKLMQMKPGGG